MFQTPLNRETVHTLTKYEKTNKQKSICWSRPASWRLRPDLDQDEAHALQVLDVLLEEDAGNLQQPGLFLEAARQHVSWVSAVASVPPWCCGVTGAMPFLSHTHKIIIHLLHPFSTKKNWVLVQCSCQCVVGSPGMPPKNQFVFPLARSQVRPMRPILELLLVTCFVVIDETMTTVCLRTEAITKDVLILKWTYGIVSYCL